MIRVQIIAPTPALRAGLRALLAHANFEVVSEATSLGETALLIADHDARVDVVVLASEHELERELGFSSSHTAVVILSDNDDAAHRLRAMQLSGWGIVPSDATADELQAVVCAAAHGLVALPARMSESLMPLRPLAASSTEKSAPVELTPRENEVLNLLSEGLPNKQIAQRLGISEATVKFHASAVYAKLGAVSRADAVSKAARLGLILL